VPVERAPLARTPEVTYVDFNIVEFVEVAMDTVVVDGLVVRRGHRDVLPAPGLTFTVAQGGVVGLLGPSGSGKTTLMRSIVGVQRIADGGVTVLGLPAGCKELRNRVGYLTQTPSVYGDLTVLENARYFASVQGTGRDAAERALETVSLAPLAGQLVRTLSGGELSRMSLACALLGEPEVLVLDEPTVGLDPVLRHELWDQFHALADAGTTLLVSSHVMDEAGRCDRLLLLREGRLLADDTPDGLRRARGSEDLEEVFLRIALERDSVKDTGKNAVPAGGVA
jgi:ABC-2 type transport system ATP-binding protein